MSDNTFTVGVVGCSGYAGGELTRILAAHPNAKVTYLTSRTYEGKNMDEVFPGFANIEMPTVEAFDTETAAEKAKYLFLATENGLAMKIASPLLKAGVKLIDLSADFRIRDVEEYEQWYRIAHCATDLLAEAVYGLPELTDHQAIASAGLISNPGCYPTACALALAPALKLGLIDPASIVIDAKSGVSGAGRSKFSLAYHYAELNEGMKAYGAPGHRHTPEIEQTLSGFSGQRNPLCFCPNLAPMTRGILANCFATLTQEVSPEEATAMYQQFYEGKVFVSVKKPGQFPVTKNVSGTNMCHIALTVDPRTNRLIVSSVIDNLVKGAAGQAVQNFNIMAGLPETAGLMMPAIFP